MRVVKIDVWKWGDCSIASGAIPRDANPLRKTETFSFLSLARKNEHLPPYPCHVILRLMHESFFFFFYISTIYLLKY